MSSQSSVTNTGQPHDPIPSQDSTPSFDQYSDATPFHGEPPDSPNFNLWWHAWAIYSKRPLCRSFLSSGDCSKGYDCLFRHFDPLPEPGYNQEPANGDQSYTGDENQDAYWSGLNDDDEQAAGEDGWDAWANAGENSAFFDDAPSFPDVSMEFGNTLPNKHSDPPSMAPDFNDQPNVEQTSWNIAGVAGGDEESAEAPVDDEPTTDEPSGWDMAGAMSWGEPDQSWGPPAETSTSFDTKETHPPAKPQKPDTPTVNRVIEDSAARFARSSRQDGYNKDHGRSFNRAEGARTGKRGGQNATTFNEPTNKASEPPIPSRSRNGKSKAKAASPYASSLQFDPDDWAPQPQVEIPPHPSSSSPVKSSRKSQRREDDRICKFWATTQTCSRRDCTFLHVLDAPSPAPGPSMSIPRSLASSPFLEPMRGAWADDEDAWTRGAKAQVDDQVVVNQRTTAKPISVKICGYSVSFGPGLTVHKAEYLSKPKKSKTSANPDSFDSLLVGWEKPSRKARLEFKTQQEAASVRKALTDFNLRGNKLHANCDRKRNHYNIQVHVANLPLDVTEEELKSSCTHTPQYLFLDKPSFVTDSNTLPTIFPNSEFPDTLFFYKPPEVSKSKAFAIIKFHSSSAMSQAKKAKSDVVFPFLGNTSISMKECYSNDYVIPARTYTILQDDLKAYKSRFKGKIVYFTSSSSQETQSNNMLTLHLYGYDRDIFFSFRTWLEKRIRGGFLNIWDNILLKPSTIGDKLEGLVDLQVVVDHVQRRLYSIGPIQPSTGEVQSSIQVLLSQETKLMLTDGETAWLADAGVAKLCTEFKVEMNVDWLHRQLVLWNPGGIESAVREHLASNARPTPPSNSMMHCVVCRRQPPDPIRLWCRHLYCNSCLGRIAGISVGDGTRPFACRKDNRADCHEPADVALIFAETNENALLDIFLQYARLRPSEYQFCPTWGCKSVLPVASEPGATLVECHSCKKGFCVACRSRSHVGVSCETFQTIVNTGTGASGLGVVADS